MGGDEGLIGAGYPRECGSRASVCRPLRCQTMSFWPAGTHAWVTPGSCRPPGRPSLSDHRPWSPPSRKAPAASPVLESRLPLAAHLTGELKASLQKPVALASLCRTCGGTQVLGAAQTPVWFSPDPLSVPSAQPLGERQETPPSSGPGDWERRGVRPPCPRTSAHTCLRVLFPFQQRRSTR